MALRRYFGQDELTIICTSSGRYINGNNLSGLGMLARYFPCFMNFFEDAADNVESSLVSSYWKGYRNDFSDYLQKVFDLKQMDSKHIYLFSYNFDNYDEVSFDAPAYTDMGQSKSNAPQTGIFDISVSTSVSLISNEDKKDSETLLFRIEYCPKTIDWRRFISGFHI